MLDAESAIESIAEGPTHAPVWPAHLDLGFVRRGENTRLERRSHLGPLRVQRPFYPEGPALPHVYVLHPPGGLVSGDTLKLTFTAETGAQALLTTPAAGKVYRSRVGGYASQQVHIQLGPNAQMEWLPQETIVFRSAHGKLTTQVDLAPGARFLGWELLCLGRPTANERFDVGQVSFGLELWRTEGTTRRPLFIDRWAVDADRPLDDPAGLRGQPVLGTLVATPAPPQALEALRLLAAQLPPGNFGSVTIVSGVMVLRYLGPNAERARQFFVTAWTILRPLLLDRPACVPRIWAT